MFRLFPFFPFWLQLSLWSVIGILEYWDENSGVIRSLGSSGGCACMYYMCSIENVYCNYNHLEGRPVVHRTCPGVHCIVPAFSSWFALGFLHLMILFGDCSTSAPTALFFLFSGTVFYPFPMDGSFGCSGYLYYKQCSNNDPHTVWMYL